MKQLKENKIYTEKFLIKKFIKEFNNLYNTDYKTNYYNTYSFRCFLREKGFVDIDKDLYLYNKGFNKYLINNGL